MTTTLSSLSATVDRISKRAWLVRNETGGPVAALEVIRLDPTSWRISDSSIKEADPGRLLGYVERLERDRYEVLWLAAPVQWAYVASFKAALSAVADRQGFAGPIEPERDPSIESPPVPFFHRIHRRTKGDLVAISFRSKSIIAPWRI